MPLDTPFPKLFSSEEVDKLIAQNREHVKSEPAERRFVKGSLVFVTPVMTNYQPKDVTHV